MSNLNPDLNLNLNLNPKAKPQTSNLKQPFEGVSENEPDKAASFRKSKT